MFALVAVLGPVAQAVKQAVPNVSQFLYVDDRCLCSSRAEDVLEAKRLWALWASTIGLVENDSKAQHFHVTKKGLETFRSLGVPEAQISSHPKILGVELRGNAQRKNTPSESKRLQEVTKVLRRTKFLPISWVSKKATIAAQAMAKGSWGWFDRLPPTESFNSIQSKVAAALHEHLNASVPLRNILRGHSLHLQFRVGQQNLAAAWRQANKKPTGIPCEWRNRGWPNVLDKCLQVWGWKLERPWLWWHEALQVHFSLNKGENWKEWSLAAHELRESFRWTEWQNFQNEVRRDSRCCNFSYCDASTARARKFASENFENFQILSGASTSPAALSSSKGQFSLGCLACGDDSVACTMEHLLWHCAAFEEVRLEALGRPLPLLNNVQKRLAWPTAGIEAVNQGVLKIHRAVRRWILQSRYGSAAL